MAEPSVFKPRINVPHPKPDGPRYPLSFFHRLRHTIEDTAFVAKRSGRLSGQATNGLSSNEGQDIDGRCCGERLELSNDQLSVSLDNTRTPRPTYLRADRLRHTECVDKVNDSVFGIDKMKPRTEIYSRREPSLAETRRSSLRKRVCLSDVTASLTIVLFAVRAHARRPNRATGGFRVMRAQTYFLAGSSCDAGTISGSVFAAASAICFSSTAGCTN